jgi:hypothetical protein
MRNPPPYPDTHTPPRPHSSRPAVPCPCTRAQTFNEVFGVLGWLDALHGTDVAFKTALRLGHGSTLGVSRREVSAAVKAAKAGAPGKAA